MPTELFEEMQRTTRATAAFQALRQAILEGRLPPGAPIIQADVARQLGISRAPLREALRKLEEEGLVVNIPFRGAFVSTIDRRSLDELCSFRNLIERFAVQRVIERATDEELDQLRVIVERMEADAASGDATAVDHDDIAFHTTLCRLADHALLLQVWETYAGQIRRAMALRNKVNQHPSRLAALHRPILDAILRRDLPAAEAHFAEHGTDLVAALFGDADGEADPATDPNVSPNGAAPE